MHGDGGTLYPSVSRSGTKSWVQRLSIDGKRRDLGLGGRPLVSLAEARQRAFENRKLARSGGDAISGAPPPIRQPENPAAKSDPDQLLKPLLGE